MAEGGAQGVKGFLSMFRRFAAGADAADYHGLVGAVVGRP